MKEIKDKIINAIAELMKVEFSLIEKLIAIPPSGDMGDYALPCFGLSKILRKAPDAIAEEIKNGIIKPDIISKVDALGGYVNFFVDKVKLTSLVLSSIDERGGNYGRSNMGEGKTIVIDYCAANVAKPFHMGHLPTTLIGNSLYKIYEFLGYKCIGINHLGDWGTQFGKLIVAYKKWSSKEKVEKDLIGELVRIYVKFHDECDSDDSLNDEARAAFKAIEDNDPEYVALWQWFKEVSIVEFRRVLEIMNIEFDSWDGESFYNDKMEPVIEEIQEKGLLQVSQGAQIVDLSEFDMPPCILLRSDGATLYATRDLAAIFYRKHKYDFYKVLYCVATQQNLHFKQIFKVTRLMGYEWAENLIHVANGMMSLEDGPMSTRRGTIVKLDEVIKEAIIKAQSIIEEKSPQLEDKIEVARMIGVGAVKFSALKNNRMKDSMFAWDKVLSFEGETSCYIQYTYARICSVLRKAGSCSDESIEFTLLTDEAAFDVVRMLSQFPEVVINAAEEYEPSCVSRYLIDLVQSYNKFYHDDPILGSEGKLRASRLELCKATKTIIETGMSLLGIECPEKM